MTKIYRYILDSDTGMAPCLTKGTLSLATCKPTIRRCAEVGDWVAGFLPGTDRRGHVAWAAKIEKIVPIAEYQRSRRKDAVYRPLPNGMFERRPPPSDPAYHDDPKQVRKDLSGPALLFAKASSWYFGDAPTHLPESLMHLAAAGQGHRVNNRRPGDLAEFVGWLRQRSPGIHGLPRHAPQSGPKCARC